MVDVVQMERAGKTALIPTDKVPDYEEVGWKVVEQESAGKEAAKSRKKAKRSLLARNAGDQE